VAVLLTVKNRFYHLDAIFTGTASTQSRDEMVDGFTTQTHDEYTA
jgi:hypothetical protein